MIRERCRAEDCPARALGHKRPFCQVHWRQVPQDLRERLTWAWEEAQRDAAGEVEAAVHAIRDFLGATT